MRVAVFLLLVGALLTWAPEIASQSRYDNLTEEKAAKVWLEEIVPYIITKAEREQFKGLTTSEERVAFIARFWQRRDPTPETPEQEAKLEHYHRLAFANKFFGAGRPGWRTDRGRIYILLGPPDQIDSDPMGRWAHQYPTEVWIYRDTPHPLLPPNMEFAFVDRRLTGDYELSFDLLGDSDATRRTERLMDEGFLDSMARAEVRAMNLGRPGTWRPATDGLSPELERLSELALVSQIPARNLQPLAEEVTARVTFDTSRLEVERLIEFYRASDGYICIPVSLRLPYRDFTYLEKDRYYETRFDVLGRILDGEEQVVNESSRQEFFAVPKDQFESYKDKFLLYQLILYAPPGTHELQLVVRDNASNSIRMMETELQVPDFGDSLSISSVVLADQIVKQDPAPPSGKKDPFTFGEYKVLPNATRTFKAGGTLHLRFEVYNLALDEEGKNSIEINYVFRREGKDYRKVSSTYPYPTDRLDRTVISAIPLKVFPPSNYTLVIAVTDQVVGETATAELPFHVQ